jgi:phage-related protein
MPASPRPDARSRSRRRRWRHFAQPSGRQPTREFIRGLSDPDKAAVLAAMAEVRDVGVDAARHLGGDIYEVRADGERVIYRVLFAREGASNHVLLALHAFKKKTQKTPPAEIQLANRRLRVWRSGSNG